METDVILGYLKIILGGLLMIGAFVYFEYVAKKDKIQYKDNNPHDAPSKFEKYRGFLILFLWGFVIILLALKKLI